MYILYALLLNPLCRARVVAGASPGWQNTFLNGTVGYPAPCLLLHTSQKESNRAGAQWRHMASLPAPARGPGWVPQAKGLAAARTSLPPAGALDPELAPPRFRLGAPARASHVEPAAHASVEGVVGHHAGRWGRLRCAAACAKGKAAGAKSWGRGGGAKTAWGRLLLLLRGACRGRQAEEGCRREVRGATWRSLKKHRPGQLLMRRLGFPVLDIEPHCLGCGSGLAATKLTKCRLTAKAAKHRLPSWRAAAKAPKHGRCGLLLLLLLAETESGLLLLLRGRLAKRGGSGAGTKLEAWRSWRGRGHAVHAAAVVALHHVCSMGVRHADHKLIDGMQQSGIQA